MLDIAAVTTFDGLEQAAHCAIRRNLTSLDRLERRLSAVAVRGRSGIGRMRRLLLDLRTNGGPTGSQLETRFMQLLRRERFPMPVRQLEIFDRAGSIGRVDFAYPEHRIAIEVQSYEFHSERATWAKDQARLDRLYSSGWKPRLVTKEDIESPYRLLNGSARDLGIGRSLVGWG